MIFDILYKLNSKKQQELKTRVFKFYLIIEEKQYYVTKPVTQKNSRSSCIVAAAQLELSFSERKSRTKGFGSFFIRCDEIILL